VSDEQTQGDQAQKVTPCLWFRVDGEAALRLYTTLIPNSSIASLEHIDGPDGTSTMLADFTLGGVRYRAIGAPTDFRFTEAVSLSVQCGDQAEVDRYWDALTADGGEAGACGWLRDRWGMSWQIVPDRLGQLLADPDPERSARAMQAMFTMGRLDIAALDAAADGNGG
jgi:predicted 3-demethylubiquinone-9 3-methyltransferase (glyoxalase superfamily)